MSNKIKSAVCVGCGCTDTEPCTELCWWILVDYKRGVGVCSNCVTEENKQKFFNQVPPKPTGKKIEKNLDKFFKQNQEKNKMSEKNKEKIMSDEIQMIPIKQITESDTNPRKSFDPGKQAELIESIKQNGIIQPLLMNITDDDKHQYIIIDGARRFRAAEPAGLKEVPGILMNISSEEAAMIQLLSFLQTQDIHPLEEAEAYKKLLDSSELPAHPKIEIQSIASKVGKPVWYVRQRFQLLQLSPDWKRIFYEGRISVDHAVLIARQQPNDQLKMYQSGELITASMKDDVMCSLIDLKGWIARNLQLDLSKTAFPKDDEDLDKKAGSCLNCPKRTGFNKDLFNDITKDDICTDPTCFGEKVKKFFNRTIKEVESSGEKYFKISEDYSARGNALAQDDYSKCKKTDKNAVIGVITQGSKKGGIIYIKPKEAAVKRLEKQIKGGARKTTDNKAAAQKDEARRKAQEQLTLKKMAEINEIRTAVFKEIVKKQKGWDKKDWEFVISQLIERAPYINSESLKAAGITNLTTNESKNEKYILSLKQEERERMIILYSLIGPLIIRNDYYLKQHKSKDDLLYQKAKELKIDFDAIEKAILKTVKEESKPKSKKKK